MEEVALDEDGAETRGCRSHWVGAAVGQSHGEIALFAHGANYIGHQFRGIGVRHRFVSRAVGANSATFAAATGFARRDSHATDLANELSEVVMARAASPDFDQEWRRRESNPRNIPRATPRTLQQPV
jgi:hypothetical protein